MNIRTLSRAILYSAIFALISTQSWGAASMPVAYVSDHASNSVAVISLDSLKVLPSIALTGPSPTSMALAPDGTRLYVLQSHLVSVVDTLTRTVLTTIPVGNSPDALSPQLTVAPDGKHVYVANTDSGSITVIDTISNSVAATIPTFVLPTAITHHPTRNEIWVGYNNFILSGTVVLAAYSTIDHSLLATASSGPYLYGAQGITFRSDGSEAFGTEGCGCCGRFHRISGAYSNGIICIPEVGLFSGGNIAVGVVIHPATGTAYFAQQGHCFSPPAPRLSELGGANRVLPLPEIPYGLAITPDGERLCIMQSTAVRILDRASLSTVTNIPVGSALRSIVTGSVPTEPGLTVSVAAVMLCWNSVSNAEYQVEYRSDLTTNLWQALGEVVRGVGPTNCVTDDMIGQSKRFYRVKVLK